jgi:hypothetical protein
MAITPAPVLTLVVEDGTGLPDANSYISLADANTYLAASIYNDPWFASDDTKQTTLLIAAARDIEHQYWFKGYQTNYGQRLQFPRTLCPDRNSRGNVRRLYSMTPLMSNLSGYFPMDFIPEQLKFAQAEHAKDLLVKDRNVDDPTKGLSAIAVGSIKLAFNSKDRARPFTDTVENFLADIATPKYRGGMRKAVA